jgi:Protein of unknown function (DUF2971)
MEVVFDTDGIPSLIRFSRYLFRFVRADDNLLTSLQQRYLWFGSPLNFNDPFDCRNVLDTENTAEEIFQYVSEFGGAKLWNRARGKEIARKLSKDQRGLLEVINGGYLDVLAKVRMCCFSEINDHTLMWSHYADMHRGVCLVFDFSRLTNSVRCVPIRVTYATVPQKYNFVRERVNGKNSPTYSSRFDATVLGTKTLEWQYEKEVRLIGEEPEKKHFDSTALVGIIFGAKIDSKIMDQLIAEARRLNSEIAFGNERIDLSANRIVIEGFENTILEQEVIEFIDKAGTGSPSQVVLRGPVSE